MFHVTVKPIDDSPPAGRENDIIDNPADVEEIYSLLREGFTKPEQALIEQHSYIIVQSSAKSA